MGRKKEDLGEGEGSLERGPSPSPSPTYSPRTSLSRVSYSLRGRFYTAMRDKVQVMHKGMKPG